MRCAFQAVGRFYLQIDRMRYINTRVLSDDRLFFVCLEMRVSSWINGAHPAQILALRKQPDHPLPLVFILHSRLHVFSSRFLSRLYFLRCRPHHGLGLLSHGLFLMALHSYTLNITAAFCTVHFRCDRVGSRSCV